MRLDTVINEILILFIIMFIGFLARKRNIVNENIQSSISTLLMRIALPSLVLSSSKVQKDPAILPNIISIFIITVISYIVFITLSITLAKVFKLKESTGNVFISLIVFANVGFMGYPVALAIFGAIGVFYTSIVNLVFALFLWTYGVLLYNNHGRINFKNLINLGTISALTAVILFIFNIKLPYSLQTSLELIGKMTTPLSMILIGALIAEVSIKVIFSDWKIFIISVVRLIAAPLITALALSLVGFNNTVIAICSIMAAMPSAATNAIFAKEYNSEPRLASIGVFVTTLFCIISLPFIMYLLIDVFKLISA